MGAIQDALARYGAKQVDKIRMNIASAAKSASGQTSSEIIYKTPTENSLIISGPPWVYTLETGRGPRVSTQSSGLKSKILQWIGNSNISLFGTADQAARSITWFMNKHGSKLFREGGRKDILTPVINDKTSLDELQEEVADILLTLSADRIEESVGT